MAKVSTHTIKTYQKDIQKEFKLNLMYNSEFKFHMEIPLEFYDVVHHLSNHAELSIEKTRKAKGVNVFKYYVTAQTESLCLDNTKKCLEHLVDKSVVQRNVIIVFYNPKDLCNYNEHRYNEEHPQIGLQFGLTYAVETSVGDKKVYSIYPEGGYRNGCVLQNRKELHLWNTASTIIPDTPENRATLENLYNAFIGLNEKLKSFMQSPEKLLEFIKSNVKLLN